MSSSTPISTNLLVPTAKGLYCERGGFFIDPRRPVARAITTHAHTDHAPPGCDQYVCTQTWEQRVRRLSEMMEQE
jgi:putative mRNA 3-end processing factor